MKMTRQLLSILLVLALSACSAPPGEQPEMTDKSPAVQPPSVSSAQNVKEQNNAGSRKMSDSSAVLQEAMPAAVIKKTRAGLIRISVPAPSIAADMLTPPAGNWNRESYNALTENGFVHVATNPLSTFSIDVDTASYSNIRRFISQGTLPPVGAVRIEEMINYFSYDYPEPKDGRPFSVTTELGPCAWNDSHKLVHIGLKAKDIAKKDLPSSNLVFLIDVSGSMAAPNKLPLLKKSMKLLVKQLDQDDRVSIVVYAGSDRIVLEPTSGADREQIFAAIDQLGPGGSTHGSQGIITAYKLAEQVKMPKGNNRIILASDGDFNVGITSRGELLQLIEKKRESGVYLTVLGFGMGNFHDDTMELLADAGNGNYSYIDNLLEAKKVMVREMSGTLFALANDVKVQVEFNPAKVGAYRLIGYENRALADEDFNNDNKDAGEIGVGHTVTALYELVPVGANDLPTVDPLKYQKVQPNVNNAPSDELLTVKLRYKPRAGSASRLFSSVVRDKKIPPAKTSDDFRFASAVAGYGMILKNSPFLGTFDYDKTLALAQGARGGDEEGYRAEFIRLVEMSRLLPRQSLQHPDFSRANSEEPL